MYYYAIYGKNGASSDFLSGLAEEPTFPEYVNLMP
jgi:hypothetical protein